MGTYGIRNKKRKSQINDEAISQIMKMYDNSKLRSKERLFDGCAFFITSNNWFTDSEGCAPLILDKMSTVIVLLIIFFFLKSNF